VLGKRIGDAKGDEQWTPKPDHQHFVPDIPVKTNPPPKKMTVSRFEPPACRNEIKKGAIDSSTMGPDHQADEQLHWAVLSTF